MVKHKNNFGKTKSVNVLKDAELRPTRQRVILVSNIFKYGNRHINAESLLKEILGSGEQVSLATVYNTLHHLLFF